MKYLIVRESPLCVQLSTLLVEEIRRFDVRHEVESNSTNLKTHFRQFNPNLLIVIGTSKSFPLLKKARKRGIKCCFFYQTLLDKHDVFPTQLAEGIIYPDIPREGINASNIFLLSDVIRKRNDSNTHEGDLAEVSIFYSESLNKKFANSLVKKISKYSTEYKINVIDISLNLNDAIQTAQRSNASVALDQFSNVFSAYTNCPTINVYQKSLFRKSNNENSVLNRFLGMDVICNIPVSEVEFLDAEIRKVLNDHQRCAGIMQGFQELRSLIGNQPFARRAAQEIVEWLEQTD